MLKITYSDIAYDNKRKLSQGQLFLYRNQPLTIAGENAAIKAFFQYIQTGKATFSQDQPLDRFLVQKNITVLTPELTIPKNAKVADCFCDDITADTWLTKSPVSLTKEERIEKLSLSDRLYIQTIATLANQAHFLILIYGDWNSYEETVLSTIRDCLQEVMHQGCYVMIAQDSDRIWKGAPTWDILSSPPVEESHYLEESVPLQANKTSKRFPSLKKTMASRLIVTMMYVLLTTLFITCVFQQNHLFDSYINEYQKQLNEMEEHHQYLMDLIYANGDDSLYAETLKFDETLARIQDLSSQVKIHPHMYGGLNISLNSDRTVLIKNGNIQKIPFSSDESYLASTFGGVICTYHKDDTNAYYGIPDDADPQGIYISSELYDILGKDAIHGELRTNVSFPVYMLKKSTDDLNMVYAGDMPLDFYKVVNLDKEVTLPINGIYPFEDNSGYCWAVMEESLFTQYQKQLYAEMEQRKNDAMIPFQSFEYTISFEDEESLTKLKQEIANDPEFYVKISDRKEQIQIMLTGWLENRDDAKTFCLPSLVLLGTLTFLSFGIYVCFFNYDKKGPWSHHLYLTLTITFIMMVSGCILWTYCLEYLIPIERVYEWLDQYYSYGALVEELTVLEKMVMSLTMVNAFHLSSVNVIEYILSSLFVTLLPGLILYVKHYYQRKIGKGEGTCIVVRNAKKH